MAAPVAFVLSPAAARKVNGLIRGNYDSSSRRANTAKPLESEDLPTPYTIRYSASNEGFIIYLPSEIEYLNYSGSDLKLTGLTAAANYPGGWFKLPDNVPGEGGKVYLVISETAAELKAAKDPSKLSVLLATAGYDDETGAANVYQLISQALVLAGGGGGSTPQGGFAFTGDKIAAGVVCFGRQCVPVAAKTFAAGESPDGFWRVKCAMSTDVSPRATIEKVAASLDMFAAPTDDYCYLPLFEIEGGAVVTDYRGVMPVVVRE